MFRRKITKEPYDKEKQKPVIRASICTSERVAGFKDIHMGRFTEVMLIQTQKDMDEYLEKYDIAIEDIAKEW